MARLDGLRSIEDKKKKKIIHETMVMMMMNSKKKQKIIDEEEVEQEEGEGEVSFYPNPARPGPLVGWSGPLNKDPLEVLGEDIMMKIMRKMDARSLARSLLASRSWFSLASSDQLWLTLCDKLWIGKAHIPRWSQIPGLSKLACYSRAVTDSKRIRIMREDLCDHAWDFHFTEAAPDYWKNLDPHWKGTGTRMLRYFHADGSQTADPEDRVWGGHECVYTIVTSIIGDGKIRENYVRINRWPRLAVSRRDDWGWEMSNVIFAYSSIADAHKEGGTGPMF